MKVPSQRNKNRDIYMGFFLMTAVNLKVSFWAYTAEHNEQNS